MLLHHANHRAALHARGARVGRTSTRGVEGDHDEGPGLLSSRAFWVGGLVSLAIWLGLAAACGAL